MSIEVLVAEYPGDRAWSRFVAEFPEVAAVVNLPLDDALLRKVLTAEMGSKARDWLRQPVSALGGRTPASVLTDHPQGTLAIRSLVMRMPR